MHSQCCANVTLTYFQDFFLWPSFPPKKTLLCLLAVTPHFSLPQLLATTDLSVSVDLPDLGTYIDSTRWNVLLCVWLLSLNVMLSGFIYFVACVSTSFFLWLIILHYMHIPQFFGGTGVWTQVLMLERHLTWICHLGHISSHFFLCVFCFFFGYF
jgi:hypothetical protein